MEYKNLDYTSESGVEELVLDWVELINQMVSYGPGTAREMLLANRFGCHTVVLTQQLHDAPFSQISLGRMA